MNEVISKTDAEEYAKGVLINLFWKNANYIILFPDCNIS
jgi:hypothetical protein